MKNTVKVLAIIALAAVFGLAFPACNPEPEGDGTSPHTHTYATTWKSNATQHWHECSCGDKTDVADHEWEWVETTAPTLTADGEATETCTTCGATSGNTRPIAKLEEQPHEQTPVTINLSFGGDSYTATVKGNLTDTQWNGVAKKIEDAINEAYAANTGITGAPARTAFRNLFENGNVVINAENTTEYSIYKVVASNKTNLYININGLNDLKSKLTIAITAMEAGEASIDGVTPPPCTTCLTTYGTTAHLGIDANGNVVACTCGGTNCSNCTEQTATLSNGTTKVRKEVGVSVEDFNAIVELFNGTVIVNIPTFNATEIRVRVAETGISHQGKILFVGCDEDLSTIMPYLALNDFLAQIQQSKIKLAMLKGQRNNT